jgi:hypothetical protein
MKMIRNVFFKCLIPIKLADKAGIKGNVFYSVIPLERARHF